ncbi:PAS domain-containing protein [Citreimonas salinaria]|uniref:histidine kinase n=1 Tax=Citreimonas salinaria TaxID=321339 RepID=A0A1H3K1U2_9RHOB|nr:PAS domain-containing protein [Citreimonas salinaria]SDY46133.1 PAS domain S-box-containing protein [Citreimonas salinaria]
MPISDQRPDLHLLELASEVSQTGAWYYDIATDRVTWSRVTRQLFEQPDDAEIDLDTALGFYRPESRKRLTEAVERCIQKGTPFDLKLEVETPERGVFVARSVGRVQRDAQGRIIGLAGSFQDITVLVRAEQRREAAEAELEFVMRTMSDGFFLLDKDWCFSFVNAASERMLQRKPADLIGRCMWEAFPEAVGSSFERNYRAVRETGRSVMFVEFFEPLQAWFEVNAHPAQTGVAVHFRDITDRVAEREQLHLFLTAVEHQPVGVMIVALNATKPLLDQGIGYANEAMTQSSRRTRRQLSALSLRSFLGDTADTASLERFADAIERGQPARETFQARTPAGKSQIYDATGAPIIGANGAVTHAVVIMDDVTERRRAEAEARRTERLALLGQLAGGVSHDFNNLLAVIMGNIELMGLTEDPAEADELRNEAVQAVLRGKTLNESLLAFAGRATIEPRTEDLGDFLRALQPLLRRTLPSNIELVIDCRPGLPPVVLDQAMAESCVLNLVINAREALPEGGRIDITVEERTARHESAGMLQRWTTLVVRDNGKGIPADLHEVVFDPFFTTRGVGEGSGLGLSRVRGYVEQTGGFVTLDSAPGRGTTISLFFPIATVDDRVQQSDRPASAPLPSQPRGRVLLVDDTKAVARVSSRILESLGYEVRVAHDGDQAAAIFEREGPFEYLLTDIVMPGEAGNALAARLRKRAPGLGVILMSGYPQKAEFASMLDDRTVFLDKPVTRDRLADALRSLG